MVNSASDDHDNDNDNENDLQQSSLVTFCAIRPGPDDSALKEPAIFFGLEDMKYFLEYLKQQQQLLLLQNDCASEKQVSNVVDPLEYKVCTTLAAALEYIQKQTTTTTTTTIIVESKRKTAVASSQQAQVQPKKSLQVTKTMKPTVAKTRDTSTTSTIITQPESAENNKS